MSFATNFHYHIFVKFSHIPNLNFLPDASFNGKNRVLLSFFNLESSGCKHWDLFKKALFLGNGGRKMLIRGVGAALRVVRNHSKFNFFCILFCIF